MKYPFLILSLLFSTCFTNQEKEALRPNDLNLVNKSDTNLNNQLIQSKMKITIDSKIFIVTLDENKTTAALKVIMPLTLNMNELNGNEKYFQLSTNLPTKMENIGNIQEGDLMLWGTNTLVLFYKSFQTSYKYTKIGRIENPTDLASVVGLENINVIFELE